MNRSSRISYFFGAWAAIVVLIGGALTSFHQPFRLPEADALSRTLVPVSSMPHWTVTHILSGGCGCSRRVMLHLLQRKPTPDVFEQVVLVDGGENDLPGTDKVLSSLRLAGFAIVDASRREVTPSSPLNAVPLLMVTSPQGKVAYVGGYGTAGDKDDQILHQLRAGLPVAALPVIGCAVGKRARRLADPFRLKY